MSNVLRRLSSRRDRFFLFFAAIVIFLTNTFIFAYNNDSAVYMPAAYTSFQPPAAGGSYTDAVFGSAVKRLTNSMSLTRADNGGTLATIEPEYSTMSPFNMDNTRLLLVHFSYFGLYDGDGNFLKNLPLEINSGSEPRWSRSDPNVLYYVRGNQLKQYNAGTDAMAVVHTFSEYTSISGMGESDICFDGHHMVFAGDKRYVFVYDIAAGTKGPALDTGGRSFDSLYITPDDNVTITWNSAGTGRFQGIELFDISMNFQRQIARAGGHMDVTRDTNGDEVAVWMNAGDPKPICDNGIIKIRLADAQQTCLISLDWSLAVHISAPDNAGWAMVETYAPGDPMPPNGWKRYTDEFLQVKLDGSEIRRLAHHRSRPLNSYTYMPKVSVSRDGSKAVFGSNFGLQSILKNPAEYSDAYMIDLTAASPGSAGSTPPPSNPAPPPAAPPVTPPPAPAPPSPAPAPPTGAPTVTRYEQSSASFSGTWYDNGMGVHSGGSAKLSMDAGARATFSFTGTGVTWIAYCDEWSGIAKVYVDGALQGQIDTYASPSQAQSRKYSIGNLANGSHSLTIEATGNASSASQGRWIWVDAFDVAAATITPSAATPPTPTSAFYRLEENNSRIQVSDGWFNNSLAAHSGGGAKVAMYPGAKATLSFTGTQVSWIAYHDEWSGIANVYIDGVFRAEVDTYATPFKANVVTYHADLPDGPHTITVEVAGRHSSGSQGNWVWLDAFDYIGAQ
jgi:hypothetical protein